MCFKKKKTMASSALVVKVLWCLKGAGLQIKNQWRDLKSARIFQKVFAVKNRQKFPKQEVKTFTNCDTCQWDALKNGVKLLVWAFTPFSHFYIICKRFKKKLYPFRSPVLGNIAKSTGCFPSTSTSTLLTVPHSQIWQLHCTTAVPC